MRQVILILDETGGYVVEVPSLPGCYSQGKTEEEALVNIREAIALHMKSLIEDGEEVPEDVGPALLRNIWWLYVRRESSIMRINFSH